MTLKTLHENLLWYVGIGYIMDVDIGYIMHVGIG